MITWAERKEVWKIHRELRDLQQHYFAKQTATEEEERDLAAHYFSDSRPFEIALAAIESRVLLRSARKWPIEVELVYDADGPVYGKPFLTEKTRKALRLAIRNARREAATFWIGVLVPPLSLLVALL